MSNEFYENYKEQVVHLIGGVNEYIGEFVSATHKNGSDWFRLKNPCLVNYMQGPIGAKMIRLMSVFNAGAMYKQYIDIRIPKESLMEILTLLPGGQLMENYIKESTREKSSLIIPESGIKLH